ncbi:hypothetical protein NHJ13734_004357 [Beauveria thailandica]
MPRAAALRAAASHAYMLGLHYLLGALTAGFTVILREGCASAGGRFDTGRLPYFRAHATMVSGYFGLGLSTRGATMATSRDAECRSSRWSRWQRWSRSQRQGRPDRREQRREEAGPS